jgi:hypothetical protein
MIDKNEFLEDHILGSGMFGFCEWWTDVTDTDDGITVTSWEGVHTLTASQVRSAFVTLVMEGFPALKGTDLDDPDIDATMADCVLQKAAFGDVIYG